MPDLPRSSSNWRRTRRNILAVGGILSGALFARVKSAKAHDWDYDPGRHHCFLRGTRILTPCGERKIEDLEIGDRIVTSRGESRIQWIGRLSLRESNKEVWTERIMPVRFARGALAPNLPHTDLWVSQEHALLIDGLLVRAVDLVNGRSIAIDCRENSTEIEYLHIKLADPDFIFAEGVPSETLIFSDHSSEGGFDNFEEYERLYGSVDRVATRDVISFGRRARIKSHLRSALSPLIDRRTEFDKVRDRLQERGDRLAA